VTSIVLIDFVRAEPIIGDIRSAATVLVPSTTFMESLMNNDAAMIVKAIIEYSKDDIAPIQSISITNAYGVNAILTEKTPDYIQGDKKWWNEAKKQGVHIMSGTNSDEPQRVYTVVVALTINDSEGNFVGVIKAIIVLEKTLSK